MKKSKHEAMKRSKLNDYYLSFTTEKGGNTAIIQGNNIQHAINNFYDKGYNHGVVEILSITKKI